jgi:mitofusin
MFRRKKDLLARQVDFGVEIFDFFDLSGLWERQEKAAGTSMVITVAGVVGTRLIGGVGWVDSALGAVRVVGINNARRLVVPGLIAAGRSCCLYKRLLTFLVVLVAAYSLASIPTSLPRRLSAKLSAELSSIDYTHSNASRISAEVRRALKFPSDALKVGLKRNLEQLTVKREDTAKVKGEAERARKYFASLVREAGEISESVRRVDLEGTALHA